MSPSQESCDEQSKNFTVIPVEPINNWAQKCGELQKENEELRLGYVEYKCQANYWQAQFERLSTKFKELEHQLAKITEELRKREYQLFGRKSEKSSAENKQTGEREEQRRSRGHLQVMRNVATKSYLKL